MVREVSVPCSGASALSVSEGCVQPDSTRRRSPRRGAKAASVMASCVQYARLRAVVDLLEATCSGAMWV